MAHVTPTRPKTPAAASRTAPTPTAKSPFPAKTPVAAAALPSKSPFASKSPAPPHPVFRVGGGAGSSALVPTPAASYAVQVKSGLSSTARLPAHCHVAQAKSRTGFTANSLRDMRHANSFAARCAWALFCARMPAPSRMLAVLARAMQKWPPGGSLIDNVNFEIETEFQLVREEREGFAV